MHILALQPNLSSPFGARGPRTYFYGFNGLRPARLGAARVARFGERAVAAGAALPGGLWSALRVLAARSAPSFASA
jgi:hypothetical protein